MQLAPATATMEHNAPNQTDTLGLPDGRVLAWTIYGGSTNSSETTDRPTVFYFHGFPGSRLEAALIPLATLQSLNVRCISMDRPGMGLSTYYESRRTSDWPSDVLAVADHLGIRQFHILGFSAGAAYALACARSIPRVRENDSGEGRLLRVALVSGVYPPDLGTEGLLFGARMLLFVGAWVPRLVTGPVIDWLVGRKARDENPKLLEDFYDKEASRSPEVDRKCLQDERFRRVAIDAARESMRQGGQGPATDLKLLADIGVKIKDISDEGDGIHIWHGTGDQNTPSEMAEKAAKAMPRSRFRALDGEGHLSSPISFAQEIMQALVRGWPEQ